MITPGSANPLLAAGAEAYQIQRSLRFNSADSAYLNRTPASAGNRKTWTWSAWVKRSALSALQELFDSYWANNDNGYFWVGFTSADAFEVQLYNSTLRTTTQVFRDPSAWYHFVLAVDTTQATAANRVKVYLNGSEITTFSTNNAPTQNLDTAVNYNGAHYIGTFSGAANLFNGYMADVYLIDGSAKTPSDFGETDTDTGVWKPKAYSGTYGTNGFYLKFADNSGTTSTTLGKDSSGNGNNWTPNNFSVTAGAGNDSLVDTPTPYGSDTGAGGEVRGNYATWNPLDKNASISALNGNLDAYVASGSWFSIRATIGITSGKWYWETVKTSTSMLTGIGKQSATLADYVGADANGWGYYQDGRKFTGNVASSYGATFGDGDVIGVAFDADAGNLYFYKNGSVQNSGTAAFTGLTSGPYFPMVGIGNAGTVTANFGQRPFAYTAPSGFKALCTQNLPTPTIGATATTQAGKYFNTVLYTGTGSSLGVTGVGFQPDFVWIKGRSGATDHGLYDAVRGVQKQLESNNTGAETTETTGLTAFGTDGFTVGALAQLNTSTATYVGWNWKGNGAGSSNTSGTITSTVSANTTAGFSIVTYTGTGSNATVGHGLGVAPKMIIVKGRSNTYGWVVWQQSIYDSNPSNYLVLSSTAAAGADSSYFTTTAPTSSVFSLGTAVASNQSSQTFVAYCFAPVAGYSAFGSYTANASTDGPFVYCGFRPRYVLIKASGLVQEWIIEDSARDPYNVANHPLLPNSSNAEGSATNQIDFVSNGFKIRASGDGVNYSSGATYIYAAFASNPFKYSLGA